MKAILILNEMPSCCNDCPCFDGMEDRSDCKYLLKEVEDFLRIDKDCPLKPLPEPKDEHVKLDYSGWDLESIINAENRGYNRCLEELLGEENGKININNR